MSKEIQIQEVTEELLQEIVRRIVRVADPDKIIVFGSRARGDSRFHSDLDLLVIKESAEPRHRRSIPLLAALSDIITPMDILVYTPEEVRDWCKVPQAFPTTAVREGKVLHDRKN